MANKSKRLHLGVLQVISVVGVLLSSQAAWADVPLTRADVEALLNRVELLPRGRDPRPARLSDALGRGDGLRTARSSRAELRFNDGSLARIGEHATFRFIPNTRNFRLSNGTALMLIPPGQGRSTIQTPNVVTGVQGTALIVRHVEARNFTLVMALTDSEAGPLSVTLLDGTEEVSLQAGQLAMIQDNQMQVADFDLEAFYKTSDLVEGLHLDDPDHGEMEGDPINAVRQETLSALTEQREFSASASVLDPSLIQTEPRGPAIPLWEATLLPSPIDTNLLNGGVNNNIPPQVVSTPPGGVPSPTAGTSPGRGSGATPATPATPGGPGSPATPATPATPPVQ